MQKKGRCQYLLLMLLVVVSRLCFAELIPNPKKCKPAYEMERLSEEKKLAYREELFGLGWELIDVNSLETLKKGFVFQGFEEAFSFMTNIALQAVYACHHPDWRNFYNKVDVELTSREAGGLTVNDITMAHYINNVAEISLGAPSPYREFKPANME